MRDMEHAVVPQELQGTYDLLTCAFPEGIAQEAYLPVVAILAEEMSFRQAATVVAIFTRQPYPRILNDLYGVTSTNVPSPASIRAIKSQLLPCGYQSWVNEDG
jgi:hypothetical protein